MDQEQGNGFGKRRAAPILNKENWRTWFSLVQDHLEGQDAFWVISGDRMGDTPETPESTASDVSSPYPGIRESVHSPEWRRTNAKARYEIMVCLSQDDQDEVLEERKAAEIWKKIKAKYSKVYVAHAMSTVQEFINFKMTEEWTIRKAWVHLGNLARRIAEVDPEEAHYKQPERRLKHLLSALPEVYQSTKDTILAQPALSYENSLQLLESHESRLEINQETAMFARRGTQEPLACFLCGGAHVQKECPGLERAKRAAKTAIPNAGYRVEKRHSPPRSRRGSSLGKDELKDIVKKLKLKVQSLEKKSSSSKKYPKKAYAAQDAGLHTASEASQSPSDDEDVDEVAHSTVEAKGN